jgi:hypothetical protein
MLEVKVSGPTREGQTLWAPVGFQHYRWFRCDRRGSNCKPIKGATKRSYRVPIGDANRTFRCDAN